MSEKRWEHQIVAKHNDIGIAPTYGSMDVDILTAWELKGWELAGADNKCFYFKRRINPDQGEPK